MTNNTTVALIIHAVVGLAIIAALSVLAALHVITGAAALYPIVGIAGTLLGTGAATIGSTTTVPPTSTPALKS